MDEYLECLYDYIVERRVGARLWASPEYAVQAAAMEEARQVLENVLSPVQRVLFDDLRRKESDLTELEQRALFQEAVALGDRSHRPPV